jgi:hypothetical protein
LHGFPGLEKAQYTVIVRALGYREAQQQINQRSEEKPRGKLTVSSATE